LLVHRIFLHFAHCLSKQYEQKQAWFFTIKVVKLCLLVAHIECIFIVLLIWPQLKELKLCGTSSLFTSQKTHCKGLRTPVYDTSSLFDKNLHRKSTTSSAFWSFAPWASSYSFRKNLLIVVPTPSCKSLPCPLPKKLHNILHPQVKLGYLLTKTMILNSWIEQHDQHSKPNATWVHNH